MTTSRSTPKQRVLKKYPHAQALNPQKGYWWIHRNAWPKMPRLDGFFLGSGSTAAAAWASAAVRHA